MMTDEQTRGEVRSASPRRRIPVLIIVFVVIAMAGAGVAGWLVDGEKQMTRPNEFHSEFRSPVGQLTQVVYSHDGRSLVAGSATGQVVVWNLATKQPQVLKKLTSDAIVVLAMSPDGFIGAGDASNRFVGWQLGTEQTQTIDELPGAVACIAYRSGFAEPEIVLGLSDDSLVFIGTTGVKQQKSGHRSGVKSAAYHPDGDILVTGGASGRLIWRDTDSREVIATLQAHSSEISGLAFSPDGQRLATGDYNGEIKIWSTETQKRIGKGTQADAVIKIHWQRDTILTGSWDGKLRLWSAESQTFTREVDTGTPIYGMAVHPDNDRIATVANGNRVELWRAIAE